MQIVNTLTIKEIGSKEIADKAVAGKTALPIATIVGRVQGITPAKQPNKDGSFTNKMKGDFYARRISDGEEFTSSVCILPSVVHDSVLNALADSDGEVEFAIEVGVKYVDGRSIPYQFTVAPMLKPQLAKPLQSLIERFVPAGEVKSLPAAPTVEDKKSKKVA